MNKTLNIKKLIFTITILIVLSIASFVVFFPKTEKTHAQSNGVKRVDSFFSATNAFLTTNVDTPSYVHNQSNGVLVESKDGGKVTYENVVDISGYTKDDVLCKIQLTPQQVGVAEFNQLEIHIEDYNNPKIYIDVLLYRYPYSGASNQNKISMISAKPNSISAYTAMQYNVKDGVFKKSVQNKKEQGAMLIAPFGGAVGSNSEAFELFFDATDLTLYTKNTSLSPSSIMVENGVADEDGKFVFIDMDNPDYMGVDKANLWSGFTDGRVKISFEATGLYGETARYTILEIANQTFDGEYLNDITAPIMNVDLKNSTADNLPNAVVGKAYPIFNATAFDQMYGEIKTIRRNVYFGGQEICYLGNSFVPTEEGEYTLEYVATDGNNNSAKQQFAVNAVSSVAEITGSIDQTSVYDGVLDLANPTYNSKGAIELGLFYTIKLPRMNAYGGSGKVNCELLVTFNGNKIELVDNSFTPTKQGSYKVNYILTDYLGEIKNYVYDLEIKYTDIPRMGIINVVDFMTVGQQYYLAPIESELYTEWYQPISTYNKITVYKEDGSIITQFIGDADAFYTPSSADGSKVYVEYYSAKNEQSQGITYKEAVTILPDNALSDRFVVDEGVSINSTTSAMEFSFQADGDKAEFVNPLLTDGGLELIFDVLGDKEEMKNNFESVTFTFTDSENLNNKVSVVFSKNPSVNAQTSFITVNGITKEISASFYGNVLNNFYIKLFSDGLIENINGDTLFNIAYNDLGEAFNGFTSGKVFVSFSLNGISGDAGVKIIQISNQSFNSYPGENNDYSKPVIHVASAPYSEIGLGEKIQISKATVGDVYNSFVTLTVSLKDENDNVIFETSSKNGRFNGYEFMPTAYGKYYLSYTAVDSSQNSISRDYGITVKDFVNPSITVTGELPSSVKLGDSIELPTATAKDNYDATVDLYCVILDPMYIHTMVKVDELDCFKAELKGRYVIYYYAVDDNYNFAFSEKYIIKVD